MATGTVTTVMVTATATIAVTTETTAMGTIAVTATTATTMAGTTVRSPLHLRTILRLIILQQAISPRIPPRRTHRPPAILRPITLRLTPEAAGSLPSPVLLRVRRITPTMPARDVVFSPARPTVGNRRTM